jgi:tetratricopeptide (TPR) repeat protein
LTSSRDRNGGFIATQRRPRWHRHGVALAFVLLGVPLSARANLPLWLQHIVGSSSIESALYRAMQLPGLKALYPRPAGESQTALAQLIESAPDNAELYQLRARADEQALDETAAATDWKLYAAHAKDRAAAKLELADFYQRRLLIPQEIAVLRDVAAAPPIASETYIDPTDQRSWQAFDRILFLIQDQALPASETVSTFDAFLVRYPDQPAVYTGYLQFLLKQQDFPAAVALIPRYRRQFPEDQIFPMRAEALIAQRRGNIDAAIDLYDRAFQPLWPAELIHSYLTLLDQTHRQRAFVAAARAQLAAHPDGPEALNALARLFFYDQQAGRTDAAQHTLDAFRIAREARNGAWSAADLYTLAALTAETHSYAESARYHFALASTAGSTPTNEPAAQSGLAGLVRILLEAPDQPLALGAQNLTLYRDIATLDQGPGYWNGILSLWLNGTSPASEYNSENARAQSYFHRAKAAELLADLDKRFPAAPERPALHAELMRALAAYGEPAMVIVAGKQFLADFANASERLDVTDLMADAYARQNDTASEFALYEAQLTELATKANGLPLTAAGVDTPTSTFNLFILHDPGLNDPAATNPASDSLQDQLTSRPTRKSLPAATAYTRVLDRYLGRLVATNQLPRALAVLRSQLSRNPNDPLLYERLATFLQQNNLSAQQEEVYELAFAKFQEPGYYDKLARLYLRERKSQAFAAITRKVTDIFSGTELDAYFQNVKPGQPIGPQLALQLNLYAAKRFPHDLVFTENILRAYQEKPTRDAAAYESLLRAHWWESPHLTGEFLTFLSRAGKLQAELDALASLPTGASGSSTAPDTENPAALREQAEIDIFTSHFEQAAPLLSSVANLYPADTDTTSQAVSLFRSLAYLDPTAASTQRAVALETDLLKASPDSPDLLATLGDLYAEATSNGGEDLTAAAPCWRRIPTLHPGSTQGYLTSATIFWDYFQFDDALAQLTDARQRSHSPALFGYEAGAIDENRHNMAAAVDEYTTAVLHPVDYSKKIDSARAVLDAWFSAPSDAADSNLRSTAQSFVGNSEAYARLLQLATRPATRQSVDTASARAVTADPTSSSALSLRADVLAAQHHAPELAPLLTQLFSQALDHAATLEQVATIGTLAQARNLTPVYERALAKQAALTADPIQKIQLQYTLAASLEAHNDTPAAARIIDAIQAANPRILGVVRATTDFYAKPIFDGKPQPQRAIRTLLDAAKVATPGLARDFTLEAAGRANDTGDTTQARTLALALLAQTPYDARVLDLIATSYARAHDDAGLKQFFLAQLDAARTAHDLTPAQRRQDIALLRRGLIPALDRLQDHEGVLTQYIALLSAYPEDAATAQQAALYALQHARQDQLLTFLRTMVTQSPRDSRFMVLLAQVETTFDDLPAAESAYSLAIAGRKDRLDLYTARVDIELRLSQSDPAQFDRAASDFERLYQLSYHDPTWMVRLAELRARQQRPADAVKALETAYIAGHAKQAADYFSVAAQLARWNLLPEARTFAEQGVAIAGADLLTQPITYGDDASPSGATTYARILTRLGKADEALATLLAARKQAEVSATSPSVLAAEVVRQNISDDEAKEFRATFAQQRTQTANTNLEAAVRALGEAVQTFYTPEQKLAFAQSLDRLHDGPAANPKLALEVAQAAALTDREAAWLAQQLLTGPRNEAPVQACSTLQQARLKFADLAHTLESYAVRLKPDEQNTARQQAAQAFRDAGDSTGELRLERALVAQGDESVRDRFLDLLLHRDRSALTELAASKNASLADAALNYTVAHATLPQAMAAVERRSQSLPAVWRPASASLIELYFASPQTPAANASDFTRSLASDATIADRMAAKPDPTRQLTGDDFFFYASRFGVFLATVPKAATLPDPEDFLAAQLEQSPTSPAAYLDLARTYVEANNLPAAMGEYNHALELAPAIPASPAIQDELAVMLSHAGRKDDALTHWHTALDTLRQMQQHAIYPEAWFSALETITRHLGERQLTAGFRTDLETILGPYLAKNGTYRSNELLHSVYQAAATPADGVDFILTLANSAPDPNQVLADIAGASWLPDASTQQVLRRRIQLAESSSPADTYGATSSRKQLLQSYMKNHQDAEAESIFAAAPATEQVTPLFAEARIVLAARTGRLDALLNAFRAAPETAPANDTLAEAANQLSTQSAPDYINARTLREFVFDHKQLAHNLRPTDFLSLAQSRIDTKDLPGAIAILQRLTLQPVAPPATPQPDASQATAPNPYANTDSAATLLEQAHHPGDAIPFLQSLVHSVPWDASYRLRLAEAQLAVGQKDAAQPNLIAVARDSLAAYERRSQAARDLTAFSAGPDLGSKELTYLAHPTAAADARQPYFAAARIAAAELPNLSPADKATLLREAIAIAPDGRDADQARLTLLISLPAGANPSATLALFRTIQNTPAPASAETDADNATTDDDTPTRADHTTSPNDLNLPSVSLPAGAAQLDLPTQVKLAALVGSACERDGDLTSAFEYAQLAVTLSQDTPQPNLTHHRDELKTAILLDRRNAARRPVFHAALAQSVPVRPRLTAADLAREDQP